VTEVGGIDHIVIHVSDLERSSAWYTDVLGFEQSPGVVYPRLRHPGASFAVVLIPTDAEPLPSSSPSSRVDHVAVSVPSLEALDEWRSTLATRGVDVEADHKPFGSSINLYDPDGLEIELFVAPVVVLTE
jgi:catechol 2,3-dioxygenase-like lactoylglutathione lyase family enzyme